MSILLVHLGYTLMLCALVTRDVLWLRTTMILAQAILATYAWTIGLKTNVAWNTVFITINVIWVVKILRERRAVSLPDDLRPLYERNFFALSRPEFLRFWSLGRRETLRDVLMVQRGSFPDSLYFILRGTVRVSRGGVHVTDLEGGYFVAEMSLITGEPANADVTARGTIEVVRWPVEELKELRESQPVFWGRIQSAIGHDLVVKIQRVESQARPLGTATPINSSV